MFKFVLVILKLGFCLTVFYCFNKVSSQSEKNRSIPLRFISLFGVRQTRLSSYALHQINLIHRIRLPSCFSLFFKSFQGYFTVQLSRFFRYILLLLFSDNLFNISSSYFLVNNFFIIFKKIKRRRRDLNPRAGFPTYTLSRGTSSAT